MNWLDIVVVIALIGSIISGLVTGLIKSLFSLAGLIVGIVLAGQFYLSLADRLGFITNEKAAHIIAFILILVIVMIIAGILGFIFTRLVSAISLGWLNRLGGAIFGLVFGALIIGSILAILVKFIGPSTIITDSGLASFLIDKSPIVLGLLPNEFELIKGYFQ